LQITPLDPVKRFTNIKL
jgi:hypothetical protein